MGKYHRNGLASPFPFVYSIGFSRLFDVMRGDDNRRLTSSRDFDQMRPDSGGVTKRMCLVSRLDDRNRPLSEKRIDADSRFVKNQKRWLLKKSTSQRDTTLLSTTCHTRRRCFAKLRERPSLTSIERCFLFAWANRGTKEEILLEQRCLSFACDAADRSSEASPRWRSSCRDQSLEA